MNLANISFPVFKLGSKKPNIDDGQSYYDVIYVKDDEEYLDKYIVDDRSIQKDSLAARRLHLLVQGKLLYKLKYSIFFISDLLKLTTGTTWFIDSTGFIFSYRKTRRVPLVCKKIEKLIPLKQGGCLIEVEGLPARYKLLFTPTVDSKYAGLLKLDRNSYILYGVYTQSFKASTRTI